MSNKQNKLILITESFSKDVFGVYQVNVLINKKLYTYHIGSEFQLRKYLKFLSKGWSGRALHILKKWNLKEDNNVESTSSKESITSRSISSTESL